MLAPSPLAKFASIREEQTRTLTPTEQAVLDTAEQLEHLVVLMKMKAASRLG